MRGGQGRDSAGLDPGDDFVGGGSESDLLGADSRGVPVVVNMNAGRAFGLGHDRIAGWEDASFDGRAAITLIGSDEANELTVSNVPPFAAARVVVRGRSGNDTLRGTAFADHLYGGRGNDTIDAFGGNDSADGGAGTDTIDGGPGTDTCTRGEILTSCP